MLADAGYDVWLGNNRGTKFGQGHVSLNTSQAEFWDFDFEEMGLYDQPAVMDFILKHSKKSNPYDKLAAYIGFSEGTTQFFIGASMKPEVYNERVNLFIGLSPIARLT